MRYAFSICVFLIGCLFVIAYFQTKHEQELRRGIYECSLKHEKTADYLLCAKPYQDEIARIQQDANDAALISSTVALSVVATSQ